jgi:hypothetical protein
MLCAVLDGARPIYGQMREGLVVVSSLCRFWAEMLSQARKQIALNSYFGLVKGNSVGLTEYDILLGPSQ